MNYLARKIQFARALRNIYSTPDGKVFFEEFLRHTGVTKPKFTKDTAEMQWNEGRRHLGMSYLSILGQDDVDSLKERIESMNNEDKVQ